MASPCQRKVSSASSTKRSASACARPPSLGLVDQRQRAVGEDAAARKDFRRFGTQRFVFDQLQAQQRGEHAERILRQRRAGERAERGGMHRHARDRQVVVADRVHAHHGEQAAQRGQFLHGADADRAVALFIQACALVVALQLRGQRRILLQHLRVDPLHQFHQRAVQRHFGAVHAGHGLCEQAADHIRRNQRGAHQSLDYGNGGTARTRIVAGARGGGDMQSNMKQTGSAGRWPAILLRYNGGIVCRSPSTSSIAITTASSRPCAAG